MAQLTAQQYRDALALGDGLRRFLDLLRVLRGLDLSRVSDLLRLVQELLDTDDLRVQIRKGLELMKLVAEITPTERDDRIVEVIDSFLTDQVIEAIVSIVEGFLGRQADVEAAAAQQMQHRQAVEALGIPWGVVYKVALYLLDLIELIRGWKNGKE